MADDLGYLHIQSGSHTVLGMVLRLYDWLSCNAKHEPWGSGMFADAVPEDLIQAVAATYGNGFLAPWGVFVSALHRSGFAEVEALESGAVLTKLVDWRQVSDVPQRRDDASRKRRSRAAEDASIEKREARRVADRTRKALAKRRAATIHPAHLGMPETPGDD